MKNKRLEKYYLLSALGILAASAYPLYMGVRVVADMITAGTVMQEDYPKYIIPYTPISLALIAGVWLMPLLLKYIKKGSQALASVVSTAIFLAAELLLENKVVVTSTTTEVTLDDWQMFMCFRVPDSWYEPPIEQSHMCSQIPDSWYPVRQSAVEILMGNYNPAFKLHFYAISILLILAALSCFYGFARVLQGKAEQKKKVLVMQTVSLGIFLALCVLACFTAFFRDGNLRVSAVSAFLMIVFFIFFGVTAGLYLASFLTKKSMRVFVGIPAIAASLMTTLMYLGEMILLNGYLYRFGDGFFFRGLWKAVEHYPDILFETVGPAPIDIMIILASGLICGGILKLWGGWRDS